MIFPLLRGLIWFHRAPVTWLMVALNVAVFAWTYPAYQAADQALEDILDDDAFIATNGLVFSVMMGQRSPSASRLPASVSKLTRRSLEGDVEAQQLLGHLGLRQAEYVRLLQNHEYEASLDSVGDVIAIEKWQESLERLWAIQSVHPSYRLGLSAGHTEIWRWFSYQVTHSGVIHLFWNMVFLLLFGTFVEHSRGWRATLVTVWLGGFLGALTFYLLSGLSASPLVGASAAVSALIALAASQTQRRLPFVYWLLPFRGYYGVTWLPAWVLIPGFVMPDLTGWVSAQPGLSAVAYTAHIGGALVGFALGRVYPERPEAMLELAQSATGAAASSTRLAA